MERTEIPILFSDPSSPQVLAALYGGVRTENPLYTASLESVLAGRPAVAQGL